MMTNASMTNNSSRQFDRKLLIHLLVKVYLQTKVSNIQWILKLQHTCEYIHNWSSQHFSQDYDLVSHTNFTHEWRYLRFKVDSERQIFLEKLFMAIFYFILRVFARNLLRGSCRRNIYSYSYSRFDVWSGLWTKASCLL